MRRFFPPMGVACLALAVALGGTAYAVTRLPANRALQAAGPQPAPLRTDGRSRHRAPHGDRRATATLLSADAMRRGRP
jgi:hypothetical protein